MKRFLFLLTMTYLLSTSACGDRARGIDMIYTFRDFEVEAGSNTLDTYYYQSQIKNARWSDFLGDLELEDIDRITPSFARITNNEGINFDFVERVILEIYPNQDTSVDPFLEVAFRENVPLNTGRTLDLIPSLPNFKEELSDDQFTYRFGFRYREVPPFSFDVILDMGFEAFPK